MADRSVQRVALLAIHPEHATAILEGRKSVEFRKRKLAPEIQFVLLYATAPTQRVVGYFQVQDLDEDTPTAVWKRHGGHGAIPRRLFREYYAGSRTAVAILVKKATSLAEPLTLHEIHDGVTAPQSFTYLPVETMRVFSTDAGNPTFMT